MSVGYSNSQITSIVGELEVKHQTLSKYYDELLESKGRLDQDLAARQKQMMELETSLELERQETLDLFR